MEFVFGFILGVLVTILIYRNTPSSTTVSQSIKENAVDSFMNAWKYKSVTSEPVEAEPDDVFEAPPKSVPCPTCGTRVGIKATRCLVCGTEIRKLGK